MYISREKDGTFEIKDFRPPWPGVEKEWVKFTPLQPVLDALRLLDCVPEDVHIPGVGVRVAELHDVVLYMLED